MSVIVIFDDDKDKREELSALLGQQHVDVVAFDGVGMPDEGTSYERHIARWLKDYSVAIIACDKELGRYENLRGLSAIPVAEAALQLGIPFCQYSRQPDPAMRAFARFENLRRWSSEQISLEGSEAPEWAPQIKCLYDGFELLRSEYEKKRKEDLTPAETLAEILDHPDAGARIALYGSGDQGFLEEILTHYIREDPNAVDLLYARMPRVFGNWLFLSILRFPGILVNCTAAASYLNISETDFKQQDIRDLFKEALYSGPFCEHPQGPWWWRDTLDDIVRPNDGFKYAIANGFEDIHECVDPQSLRRAGYYCMLMQVPVSLENSRGNISWFPAGADLSRIRKDEFDKITALVGMY